MDILNKIGLFLLGWLNYRLVAVYTIAITAVLLCISGIIRRKMPSIDEALALAMTVISVFSGITIFCVFDLTSPPALTFLSQDSAGVFGVIAGVALVFGGVTTIWRLMKP